MTTVTPGSRVVPAGEPRPIIAPLASLYVYTRDLAWLIVRLTAGGMLLVHGIVKVMPMMERLQSNHRGIRSRLVGPAGH